MIELIEPESQYDGLTLRELLARIVENGGDLDTPLLIEADGEPVYINAYLPAEPSRPDPLYDVTTQQHNINVANRPR